MDAGTHPEDQHHAQHQNADQADDRQDQTYQITHRIHSLQYAGETG